MVTAVGISFGGPGASGPARGPPPHWRTIGCGSSSRTTTVSPRPGIASLVDVLQRHPERRSDRHRARDEPGGTGANFTTTPITVAPATTASGDAATAVQGFPADTVLYGVLTALPGSRTSSCRGSTSDRTSGTSLRCRARSVPRDRQPARHPGDRRQPGIRRDRRHGRRRSSTRLWVELFRAGD